MRRLTRAAAFTAVTVTTLALVAVDTASASGTSCPAFTKIGPTAISSLAVDGQGRVWGWGANNLGQVGDGSTTDRSRPTPATGAVTSGGTAVAGMYHSLAAKSDGSVYAWGANNGYQLGDGTNVDRSTPAQVAGISGATEVAGGDWHSLALAAGRIWAWGSNSVGQLGDGTATTRTTPVQLASPTGVVQIASTANHSLARTPTGVWAWGQNGSGQIGDGSTADRFAPVQVTALLPGVQDIAVGWQHSLALDQNGGVWAWGDNTYGQLGDGTTTTRLTPAPVSLLGSGVVDIAAGGRFSLARKSDGSVWAWGENVAGQLGLGSAATSVTSPTRITGLPTVTAIAGGGYHAMALTAGGTIYAWGGNGTGQVGDGTLTDRRSPVAITTCAAVAPVAQSVTDDPDPVVAGQPVTFSVTWSDPNQGDSARAVICRTNQVSGASCPGGSWAVGSLSSAATVTASYGTTNGDVGSHAYYAFACDSTGLCSQGVAGTFTVSPAPACSDGVDNDGDGNVDYPSDPGCTSAQDTSEDCAPVADGVVVCLAPTAEVARFATPGIASGPGLAVAGYVDLYQFRAGGVSVNLPCVTLVAAGSSVSPCAAAGGQLVSRVTTLVEITQPVPTVGGEPLETIGVCTAELTATVFGAGVPSAPAFTVC